MKTPFNNDRSTLVSRLMCGTMFAVATLAVATPTFAQTARPAPAPQSAEEARVQAEEAQDAAQVEDIVVTGTSIRGVAPVGSNIVSVTKEDIEKTGAQTVQQLLKSVPQVTGFNNAGQGGFGSADGSGTNAPTIHSLGASASNNTLILIDGNRVAPTGLNHALSDPSIVPPIALERVEVLPEGASSVYGSDAVAGVLNFITRRRYDGFEMQGQTGFADGYKTFNGGLVLGRPWDGGSAMFAYNYSYRSNLEADARDFNQSDLRDQGGNNFNNYLCTQAVVTPIAGQPNAGQNFQGPSYTTALTAPICSQQRVGDLLPEENRHSLLFKIDQDITSSFRSSLSLAYSDRNNTAAVSRGTINGVRVYGAGAPGAVAGQANPFFEGPAGVNTETVAWSADDLFGPGAETNSGARTFQASGALTYDFPHEWQGVLSGTYGHDTSFADTTGQICSGCVTLALNGTTQANGNTTTSAFPPILGNTTLITRLPLTTANALDVWRTGSANRTSQAVRTQLLDNINFQQSIQTIQSARLKFDGPLFSLPGGEVRAAIGAEATKYGLHQQANTAGSAGPASTTSQGRELDYGRTVTAAFAELLIPIIGDNNALPFVRRFDVSVAGRFDHYSDFGDTSNPKFAFTWGVVEGLTFRGAWGTSFTAPALTSIGADARGTTLETTVASNTQAGAVIPVALFPNIVGYLPGCNAGATTCTLTNTTQGLQLNGGNPNLTAQEGESSSFGFDWHPTFLPGLRVSTTYWSADIDGAITSASFSATSSIAGLSSALIFNPTAAQIADALQGRRLTTTVPSQIYYIFDFSQRNAFDIRAAGIDFDASYRFQTGIGDFDAGIAFSKKTKFDQRSSGGPFRDLLNSSGVNTTFSTLGFTGRASLGWSRDAWSADVFVNYTNAYTNLNGQQPFPLGQDVDAFTTIDTHIAYDFDGGGWMDGTQVFLDANNLLDEEPPFVNVNGGFSSADANPIGRVVTIGFRKRF